MSGIYIEPGVKVGRLTVRELVVDGNANQRRWLCDCECGGVKITSEDNLRRGRCRSCGCLYMSIGGKAKHGTERGESKTRLYKIWSRMIWRCEKPQAKGYSNYGGRGIAVCEEWHSFNAFRNWALQSGYQDNLSIDRIDNGGGYSPGNCRWANPKEQANNRRSNHKVEYKGEYKNISEWADCFGLDRNGFNSAIQRGLDVSTILERGLCASHPKEAV